MPRAELHTLNRVLVITVQGANLDQEDIILKINIKYKSLLLFLRIRIRVQEDKMLRIQRFRKHWGELHEI